MWFRHPEFCGTADGLSDVRSGHPDTAAQVAQEERMKRLLRIIRGLLQEIFPIREQLVSVRVPSIAPRRVYCTNCETRVSPTIHGRCMHCNSEALDYHHEKRNAHYGRD